MTKDLVNAPSTRNWRDIPQPVKPRTMSSGGRWRLVFATTRVVVGTVLVVGIGAGVWMAVAALQEKPGTIPTAARAMPVRTPELVSDGVLQGRHEWLAQRLALPKGATLMELNLRQLKERVLADGQVLTATLTRKFPDRLLVRITERAPVARIMTERAGQRQQLLVARDGAVFAGTGYEEDMLQTLPWLAGVGVTRNGEQYQPIAGMEAVSDLLATARLNAEHLYRTWKIVSLHRLAGDRLLEVRTHEPYNVSVVFSAPGDFLRQIAKLEYMWEDVAGTAGSRTRIDLSLGRQVPVSIEPATTITNAAAVTVPSDPTMRPTTAFSVHPSLLPKKPREL